MSKTRKFSDQLREAIKQAIAEGKSQNDLATAAGMDQGNLSSFLSDKRGLSLDAIDALADHLGWTLSTAKRTTKTKSPRKKSKKAKE